MDDIIIYDKRGLPLEFLTQWDQNQVMVIRGIDFSPAPVFRFSTISSVASVVVKPTVDNGVVTADIPNVLLTQCKPIVVHINYEYDDGDSKTRHVFNIPVIPCKQPEDYHMTENVEYVSWTRVAKQARTLISRLETERVVIEVDNTEPVGTDVLWFNTGVTSLK